jgi:hypothetical protein
MTKEAFFKSNMFKFAVPIITVALIIKIFQGGYAFGNWLYAVSH